MPIFNSPYDTTAMSGAIMSETVRSLEMAMMSLAIEPIRFTPSEYDDTISINSVQGGSSSLDVIRYFNHPIIIMDKKATQKESFNVFIDVRNFGRFDPKTGAFLVRNPVEYKLMVMRGIMNHFWLTRKKQIFRDMTYLPMKLFAGAISETIRKTYQLDPGVQLKIAIIAAYFYFGLFTDMPELSEMDKQRAINQIIQATSAPSILVEEMLDDLKIIDNLVEFCEIIKQKVGSIRLNDFNHGILFSAVSNIWNGTNAREIIPIAFEHPPTWLMVIYSCIAEATYSRSALGKLAHNYNKGDTANTLVASINSLFGGPKSLKKLFQEE